MNCVHGTIDGTQVDARTRLVAEIREKIGAGGFAVDHKQTINFTTKMAHDLDVLRKLLEARQHEFNKTVAAYRAIYYGTPRRTAHVDPHADQERRVRDQSA